MLRRFSLVMLGATLVSGCATTSDYSQAVNSWKGSNVKQLTGTWGFPSSNATAPNGNKLYIYNQNEVTSVPGPFGRPQTESMNCTTWFEVDASNTIVGTEYRGNGCSFSQSEMSRYENPFNPRVY